MKSRQEASPAKALLEEMEAFRSIYHEALGTLGARLDARLDLIRARLETLGPIDSISPVHLRDIRDMLTVLGHVDADPAKARRKDLKKLDAVTDDLILLSDSWT